MKGGRPFSFLLLMLRPKTYIYIYIYIYIIGGKGVETIAIKPGLARQVDPGPRG
jgi:hypothetical protein